MQETLTEVCKSFVNFALPSRYSAGTPGLVEHWVNRAIKDIAEDN